MDILKKQSGVILAYVILVVLLASAECAAENKTLLFVGNDSYPPISYQEGGKPKGLAIDIVRALGQRMGRQIDIRLMEWKVAQAMVAKGKADALCQLSITEARKQIYDFSDQAHDLRFSIFVRTGKQGINDLSDLRGLQVAVWTASVQHQYAMADSQIKLTLIANDLQGFQLLKEGKVDAVLADLWTGSYVLAEKMITGIQTSGEPFAHLASALAVKKGNTELLAAINDGLRSLQADGTIERINEKWSPKEVIFQTREQAVRKTYSVIIGILCLLLVVGAFWLITLRRKISERNLAEDALHLSREHYRAIVENISDVIFEVDSSGVILYFSPAGKYIWGYDLEDIVGKNFIELVHPEDQEILIKRFVELGTGLEKPMVYRLKNKAGEFKWVRTKTKPKIEKGAFIGASGTLIDITDLKQAEDLLNVRLRLMEFATSHTLSETLQKTLDEVSVIVNSPIGFYHFIDPDQKTISLQEWSTRTVREFCTAQGKGSHYDVDKAGVWADCLRQRRPIIHNDYASLPHRKGLPAGHAPVIRELVVPIMRDNLVVAILGVGNKPSDYTEKDMLVVEYLADVAWEIAARKNAEEENRNLQERLTRSEKMEALGLLAGGVAHDLNNVLGIVVGYAELVLDAIDEKSPLRKDLKTIFDGGQKAAAIVEDLLTLARRGVVDRKIINLNKLIGDFKKSPQWSKLLTYHPHVQILTDLDPDLLNISASSVHLEKTLYNLISNAGEAMAKSGNITIKTSNRYIDKHISGFDNIHEGDYAVLSVSDEGEGISETDLKRIFEPFYTKKIMGRSGTGLGLSVVWGTVRDHQGYIDVQSEEGKGTTFTLYFLITREDIAEESLAISMSEYLGNGQSLLVVDDVQEQRDLAARLLTSLNYKVSSVPSGEEAIKYLKDHQPDLIVLDMIMDPGMDGLDTYKSVLEINPKQKAIIVSGFSESDRVKEAKVLGAGAYIKKPYIKEKLGLAVKKELARK